MKLISKPRILPIRFHFPFLLLILLVVSCNREDADNQLRTGIEPSNDANVSTVNVLKIREQQETIETKVFFGKLEPKRRSQLGFSRGGTVKNVFYKAGDQVEKNAILVELVQDQIEQQRLDLETSLNESKQLAQSQDKGQAQAAQSQIPSLESQLRGINLELAQGKILAPYNLVVSGKYVEAGELVTPGNQVLEVIDASEIVVAAGLPRIIADSLNDDQSVWVDIDNQTIEARFQSRSPLESPVGTKLVSLKVVQPLAKGQWAFGQVVKIRFFVPTENSGFWLPYSALSRESNGLWSVLVVAGPGAGESIDGSNLTVARRMVELVQLENEWVLCRGTLADGDLMIVNGLHRIVPGQIVKTKDVSDEFEAPGAGVTQ